MTGDGGYGKDPHCLRSAGRPPSPAFVSSPISVFNLTPADFFINTNKNNRVSFSIWVPISCLAFSLKYNSFCVVLRMFSVFSHLSDIMWWFLCLSRNTAALVMVVRMMCFTFLQVFGEFLLLLKTVLLLSYDTTVSVLLKSLDKLVLPARNLWNGSFRYVITHWAGLALKYPARENDLVCTMNMPRRTLKPGHRSSAKLSTKFVFCWLLLGSLCPVSVAKEVKTTKRDIYIAGLFPLSGSESHVGDGVKPAVELALEHVNNDSTILANYNLKMAFSDTQCDMAVATKAFFDMTFDKTTTEAFLYGDACSNVTGPMAEISREWKMYTVSYGDTDPVLSDRAKYPNFFRLVPSDSDFNPARLALLRHFNWSIVGTIFQDASQGSSRFGYAHNRFDSLMETHKINISQVESFSDDPHAAIHNLKGRDVRIIVGNFDENKARKVFCSARQQAMYGPRHQWIILGTYSPDWWRKPDEDVPCTPQELNETLDGYLATDILPLSTDEEETESGLTPEEYEKLYDARRGGNYSVYHAYAYDGIWVIAHALEKLLSDHDVRAKNKSLVHYLRGMKVGKALNDTNIRGVTGRVQFNNGDRVGVINILQMQGGQMVKIAEYNAFTEQLDFSKGQPIYWRGGRVPLDRTIQHEEMRHVSTPVYLALVALASTGIIMACCFLGLNIHFRTHRFIKMSSPNMNNVIIVGCVLCYLSIVLLGTDGGFISKSPAFFRYWCRARAWVLALGFTLAFGGMFSKTWRVHAIFTNIKLNRKVIKDYKLMLVVLVLMMIDVAILVGWQIVDPFQKAVKHLVPEVYDDYEVIPKLEFCSSRHMEIWMGSIYAYKGLLLAFGCFLAWETRHVSIPALNDSKYIGMSVYNVVIMCTCGAAVTFLIQDQPTHSFVIIAVFIIFATTATLCLVFVPKIIQLRRDPKGDDKRIRATLRKPSRRYSDDDSEHFQHKVRLATEENRRLRGFLEQRAAEVDHLLEQLGEEPSGQDLSIKSALHKKVLELRTSDVSPSKLSRVSYQSDIEVLSTFSDVSMATMSTMYVSELSPGRQLKSRLLNNRLHNMESIELADIRGGGRGRKPSVTIPPPAEEEDDDPFGGVYIGPPDPPPVPRKPSVEIMPPVRCNNTPATTSDQQASTTSATTATVATLYLDNGGSSTHNTHTSSDLDHHNHNEASVIHSLQGLQTRLGVASTRHARASRRHSAPGTIWTIAEAEEELLAAHREGIRRGFTTRIREKPEHSVLDEHGITPHGSQTGIEQSVTSASSAKDSLADRAPVDASDSEVQPAAPKILEQEGPFATQDEDTVLGAKEDVASLEKQQEEENSPRAGLEKENETSLEAEADIQNEPHVCESDRGEQFIPQASESAPVSQQEELSSEVHLDLDISNKLSPQEHKLGAEQAQGQDMVEASPARLECASRLVVSETNGTPDTMAHVQQAEQVFELGEVVGYEFPSEQFHASDSSWKTSALESDLRHSTVLDPIQEHEDTREHEHHEDTREHTPRPEDSLPDRAVEPQPSEQLPGPRDSQQRSPQKQLPVVEENQQAQFMESGPTVQTAVAEDSQPAQLTESVSSVSSDDREYLLRILEDSSSESQTSVHSIFGLTANRASPFMGQRVPSSDEESSSHHKDCGCQATSSQQLDTRDPRHSHAAVATRQDPPRKVTISTANQFAQQCMAVPPTVTSQQVSQEPKAENEDQVSHLSLPREPPSTAQIDESIQSETESSHRSPQQSPPFTYEGECSHKSSRQRQPVITEDESLCQTLFQEQPTTNQNMSDGNAENQLHRQRLPRDDSAAEQPMMDKPLMSPYEENPCLNVPSQTDNDVSVPTDHVSQEILLIDAPIPFQDSSPSKLTTDPISLLHGAPRVLTNISSPPHFSRSLPVFHRQLSLPAPLPPRSPTCHPLQTVQTRHMTCLQSDESQICVQPSERKVERSRSASGPTLTFRPFAHPEDESDLPSDSKTENSQVTSLTTDSQVLPKSDSEKRRSSLPLTKPLRRLLPSRSVDATSHTHTQPEKEVSAAAVQEDSSGSFDDKEPLSKGACVREDYSRRIPGDESKGTNKPDDDGTGACVPEEKSKSTSVPSAGGSAQVFPESQLTSTDENEGEKKGQENLWGSPTRLASSPRKSSPRVTFVCDVVEKF